MCDSFRNNNCQNTSARQEHGKDKNEDKVKAVWVSDTDTRSLAPIKVSTSSTSLQLKSSHYDHVHITFNGLPVI